jgi:hypothetical protein
VAQAEDGRDTASEGVITPPARCPWCGADLVSTSRYPKKFCNPGHKALWHAREKKLAERRVVLAEVRALLDRLESA